MKNMVEIIKSLFKDTDYTIIDYDKNHYLAEVGTEEGNYYNEKSNSFTI